MDEKQEKLLRLNRVSICEDLEPRGPVLDTLLEDGVLTENDLEKVSSATTRKQRCQELLALLSKRGPGAYGSFKRALLAGKYEFLVEKLNYQRNPRITSETQESEDLVKRRQCRYCSNFLETVKDTKVSANEELFKTLNVHPCVFLHNIDPVDAIDQLAQDGVIDEEDIDKIRSPVTRRERCEVLFSVLLEKEVSVIESLKNSLRKKYAFILDTLSNCDDESGYGSVQSFCESASGVQCVESSVQETTSCTAVKNVVMSTQKPCLSQHTERLDVNSFMESSTNQCHSVPVPETFSYECLALNSLLKSETLNTGSNHGSLPEVSTEYLDPRSFQEDNGFYSGLPRPARRAPNDNLTRKPSDDDDVSLFGKSSERLDPNSIVQDTKSRYETHKQVLDALGGSAPINSLGVTESIVASDRRKRRPRSVRKRSAHARENIDQRLAQDHKPDIVTKQVTSIKTEKPKRRLVVAFNYLSTLINQGDYEKFETLSTKLKMRFPKNYDLMCILGYLHASRDLFRTEFESAKKHINVTMELLPKTSNPRYFALELLTAKTRMYISQKKLEKLQNILDEAMMILESDPGGCTGRAAGWLYINHARNKTAQLSCLNLRKPNAFNTYNKLFESAKTSFQRSMTNFEKDGGKDGPFGYGYALCRLVILLLRCGDNGMTMGTIKPPDSDVTSAGSYIRHLEDSDIPITKILEMHLRLAKCDYYFRLSNFVRALEHATEAVNIATELNMLEFTEHAQNRVTFLTSRAKISREDDDISEDEAQRVLFDDSSSSELSS